MSCKFNSIFISWLCYMKEEEKEKEKEGKGDRVSDLKRDYTVSTVTIVSCFSAV